MLVSVDLVGPALSFLAYRNQIKNISSLLVVDDAGQPLTTVSSKDLKALWAANIPDLPLIIADVAQDVQSLVMHSRCHPTNDSKVCLS